MLTKGIIIAFDNGNTYTVRLPVFEGAGNMNEFNIQATAAIQPGIYNGYKVGDVVEVDFEENNISHGVILGKLYLGAKTENTTVGGAGNFDTLKVTTKAELPPDTTFGGTSINGLINKIKSMDVTVSEVGPGGGGGSGEPEEYVKKAYIIDNSLNLMDQDGQTIVYSAAKGDKGDQGDPGPQGAPGNPGTSSTVVKLYKRAVSATVDWTTPLTYTFSTNTLNIIPSGWSTTEPDGVDPLFMTAATATSTEATDTIEANEWCAPIRLVSNGANGINAATIFLYQRAATAPAYPTTDLTYTFLTGQLTGDLANWSQTVPASDGNPCFVIQTTALSADTTCTITKGHWSTQVIYTKDGKPGKNGHSIEFSLYCGGEDANYPALTESQWATSGIAGSTITWTDTTGLSGRTTCKKDDLFIVTGISSDTNMGHTITFRCTEEDTSKNLTGVVLAHTYTIGVSQMIPQYNLYLYEDISTAKSDTPPAEADTGWSNTKPSYAQYKAKVEEARKTYPNADCWLWCRTKCILSDGTSTSYINVYHDEEWILTYSYNADFIQYKSDNDAKVGMAVSRTDLLTQGDGTEENPYIIKTASITAAINDSSSEVAINADKITMTGTTRFVKPGDIGSYDATSGVTTIDGGKITTGTIIVGTASNPTFKVDMDSKTLSINTSQFSLDTSGNATFAGALSAATGTFAGTVYAKNIDVTGGKITADQIEAEALVTKKLTVTDGSSGTPTTLFEADVDKHIVTINGGCITNGTVTFNSLDTTTQTDINTAKSDAGDAKDTADKAKDTAVNAQSTANGAQTAAENAQSTANEAKTKTDGLATGTTTINGGCITTGVIKSSNYQAGTAGTCINLDDGAITSKEFSIDSSGKATFSGNITGGSINIRSEGHEDAYFEVNSDGDLECGIIKVMGCDIDALRVSTINGTYEQFGGNGVKISADFIDLPNAKYTNSLPLTAVATTGYAIDQARVAHYVGTTAPSGTPTLANLLYFQIID